MESAKLKVCVTSAVLAVSCASAVYAILRYKRRCRVASEVLKYMDIKIVSEEAVCDEVISEIRRRSSELHAVGFDCEWVTDKGKRRAVALLQLSTLDGYCGLFRLNQMKIIPHSLKSLLEDKTIYKVGVAPADDAKYLLVDYSVVLNSSLDVRHLAQLSALSALSALSGSGHCAGGLASLSKSLLHIVLDKSWKVRCSDWEAEQLTERQVNYAAADAHVAIKIFGKLINEYNTREITFGWFFKNKENVRDLCNKYSDVTFKAKHNPQKVHVKRKKDKNTGIQLVNKRYPHATRSKPLYNNCILQAPDGELLCTCDSKKARWYVEKGLASVVGEREGGGEAPLAVRLRFEPAGRSVGDVGRYYQIAKENKCVVCGATDSYIRKNVVPREYRKYFPEVMKDHSSHDVVLLCVRCHQRANALDLRPRTALAALCDAPLAAHDNTRSNEDAEAKKIRSAARALLYQSQKHSLPEARRAELERAVLAGRPAPLTQGLLEAAARPPDPTVNINEECHGLKVVEYFLKHDGLLRLEEYWRDHFLDSMEPKYMPALWSTKHNEERLRVRFDEGRLSEKDIHLLGLTKWL